MTAQEIMKKYNAGEIDAAEANRQLKEINAGFSVEEGKGNGTWTKEEWEQGFIPAKKTDPWWVPMHNFVGHVDWKDELPQFIPEKEMVFNRPKYHGVCVVKGALRYIYAEDGTCKYRPKSMLDYDKAHGRV